MSNKLLKIYFYSTVLIFLCATISHQLDQLDSDSDNMRVLSQIKNLQDKPLLGITKAKSGLTPHSSIIILSDEDFITQGFPGEGTPTNPYRIENYEISTIFAVGIYVFNTTKSFIISNCFISALEDGIVITDIIAGTVVIENNTCAYHNSEGIYVWGSNNIFIRKNECYGNRNGIATDHVDYLEIKENYCHNNGNSIKSVYSNHAIVTDNTLSGGGIITYYVDYSIFERNVIVNYGLCGISLIWGEHNRIENNYCTGGVFGIITDMAQNITIINNECSKNNIDGIFSRDTDDSLILDNYSNRNNESGIRIDGCSNMTVLKNTCTENKDAGIYTYYDSSTSVIPLIIEDNTCRNNTLGMRIWETFHAKIWNNTVESNGQGILLVDSKYTEIVNNILLKNRKYGLKIDTSLSTSNVIYSNYFLCNNLNGTEDGYSQAYDESFNDWYDENTNTGNYYSDYSGEGEYQIDGRTNRTDPYPFVYDYDCYNTDVPTEETHSVLIIFILSFIGLTSISRKKARMRISITNF
ncbi:MAG: hypothetical protein GOP50_06130 [Candidatus Heimdallarchaeota archaeon]|nr:hypothetical protein [Candidatus Heimdallarchaeota archaeon]